jgi:hypothetical protein
VKVTQPVEFNLNQARPVGDNLTVSLDGGYGMKKLYKLSIPLESLFGFLATDVALDPKRDYTLEVKVAQPGFDGIYINGLEQKDGKEEDDLKVKDKAAYSESQKIILRATESKPGLIEKFWHWREKRMWRP